MTTTTRQDLETEVSNLISRLNELSFYSATVLVTGLRCRELFEIRQQLRGILHILEGRDRAVLLHHELSPASYRGDQ